MPQHICVWYYVWNILKRLLNCMTPHKILLSAYCMLSMKIPNNASEAAIRQV